MPKLSQAVILVGGPGTRLRPLTNAVPKVMVPVVNRPFLEHIIAYLARFGLDRVILTMNYLPDVIMDHFGSGGCGGVGIKALVEDEPRGTAGAVKNAEPLLDDSFVVLNGDVFTDLDLAGMLEAHRSRGARVSIAVTQVANPAAFGTVETAADGRVRSFREKQASAAAGSWINAGIYIIEPEVLRLVPADCHYMFERGLFPRLIEMGEPVYSYPFRGYWLDMGKPEKYLQLNCDLLTGRVASYLGSQPDGINAAAVIHPSARITGPVTVEGDAVIGEGARLTGPVVIGEGCRIGAGAVLERVVVWGGVEVAAGTCFKNGIVGEWDGRVQLVACADK